MVAFSLLCINIHVVEFRDCEWCCCCCCCCTALFYLRHRKLFIFGFFSLPRIRYFFLMKRNEASHSIRWSGRHIESIVLLVECIYLFWRESKKERKKSPSKSLVFFMWYFLLLLRPFLDHSAFSGFPNFVHRNPAEIERERQRNEKLGTRKLLLSIRLL